MKKLFTYCLSLLSLGLAAQSITAYRQTNNGTITGTITNGSSISLNTTPGADTDSKIKIKNNAAVSNTYNVTRYITTNVPALFTDGSSSKPNSYFCFGQTCFGSNVSTADPGNYTVLNAGEDSYATSQLFSIYLAEAANQGYYVIRYKLFNVNNANDTLSFSAIYNSADVGIKSISNEMSGISELYPNPNGGMSVSFDLEKDEDLKFQVYNSLGGLVYTTKQKYSAGKNKLSLEAADLSKGVYFVTIASSSAKTTKRLIVNK